MRAIVWALLALCSLAMKANANPLAGDIFQWEYVYEDNFAGATPATFVPDGGVYALPKGGPSLDIFATNTGIEIQTASGSFVFADGFQPFTLKLVVTLVSGPTQFATVSTNPATNISVADGSYYSFVPFSNADLQLTPTQLTIAVNWSWWYSFGGGYPESNLTLDVNQGYGVTAAVPEPSTWAMMLLGFAGLGVVTYRRQGRAVDGPMRA